MLHRTMEAGGGTPETPYAASRAPLRASCGVTSGGDRGRLSVWRSFPMPSNHVSRKAGGGSTRLPNAEDGPQATTATAASTIQQASTTHESGMNSRSNHPRTEIPETNRRQLGRCRCARESVGKGSCAPPCSQARGRLAGMRTPNPRSMRPPISTQLTGGVRDRH